MHNTSQYLTSEKKAAMATSKVEALEVEALGLRRDSIMVMDDNNSTKEKIKTLTEELNAEKQLVTQRDEQLAVCSQKMKNAVTKAIHAFQLTEEYNAILFGWYFKGFEPLKRYLIKQDLEDLDFKAIDKEIEADEVMQAVQATASVGEDPLVPEKGGNDTPEV